MRLAAEQQAAVMLGQHDHHRVDAGIMFGAARTAGARPAAAIGLGRPGRRPSNGHGGGASWPGSAPRRRSALRRRRAATSSWKWARASTAAAPSGRWRSGARRPPSQGTAAGRPSTGSPAQLAQLVDRRGAIFPNELPRRRGGWRIAAMALRVARANDRRGRGRGRRKMVQAARGVPFGPAWLAAALA